jgi:UDP:flavonoid glycosyltransferase YjiC (YdhE family)
MTARTSDTVVFFPEGAFGPTNNCVGIADVLRRRGRRVVFVIEESFAGTLEAQGFEERLMRLRALAATWHNLQTSVRATDAAWGPPDGSGPLIYVSLGSLGSADVALMRTLIQASPTPPIDMSSPQARLATYRDD